ncbi:hypothetical protein RJT34_17166 [Clitoria ternatea]|uniref:Uncharacterized protein n=1 Tax=Clitoria ternatea TaxID=43366 RepID=A0AAN9JBJ3_CLITE
MAVVGAKNLIHPKRTTLKAEVRTINFLEQEPKNIPLLEGPTPEQPILEKKKRKVQDRNPNVNLNLNGIQP